MIDFIVRLFMRKWIKDFFSRKRLVLNVHLKCDVCVIKTSEE
jgi:hypothetical protein